MFKPIKMFNFLFASKLSGLSLGLLNVAIVIPQVRIRLLHFFISNIKSLSLSLNFLGPTNSNESYIFGLHR